MPELSIVLPSYNRAHILPRAVASVLAQTVRDLELIVVDDGSKDETASVVAAIEDPRLVYLRSAENNGGNWARNRGIEAARAPIISFLDSDDEFLPHKAEAVLAFFASHPEIHVLLDSFIARNETRGRVEERTRRNKPSLDRETFRTAILTGKVNKPTPAISARRQALLEVGMFDESLRRSQDMDLLLRLSRRHGCATIDQILWRKHWVNDAISAERNTFLEGLLAICDRHPDYVSNPTYRKGLHRDVARHFAELAAAGEFRLIRRDLGRIRRDGRLGIPPLKQWLRGWSIFWSKLRA